MRRPLGGRQGRSRGVRRPRDERLARDPPATLIIASFTIFVFGGAITEVAIACDVLKKGEVDVDDDKIEVGSCRMWLLECLVVPDGIKAARQVERAGDALRRGRRATVRRLAAGIQMSSIKPELLWGPAGGPGLDVRDQEERGQRDGEGGHLEGALLEDKLDEMREVFPGKPSGALKKALDESDGDVQQAIVLQSRASLTERAPREATRSPGHIGRARRRPGAAVFVPPCVQSVVAARCIWLVISVGSPAFRCGRRRSARSVNVRGSTCEERWGWLAARAGAVTSLRERAIVLRHGACCVYAVSQSRGRGRAACGSWPCAWAGVLSIEPPEPRVSTCLADSTTRRAGPGNVNENSLPHTRLSFTHLDCCVCCISHTHSTFCPSGTSRCITSRARGARPCSSRTL